MTPQELHRAAAIAAGHHIPGGWVPTEEAAREADPEGFDYLVWMYQVRPWMVVRRLPVRWHDHLAQDHAFSAMVIAYDLPGGNPMTRLLWESEVLEEGYESLLASTRIIGWETTSLWDHFSEGVPF